MNLELLKSQLPQLAESLDRRWQEWLSHGGRPDVADFLVDLADRGIVTRSDIQDIISNLEVTLTLSEANRLPVGPRYHALGMLGKGAMGEVHLSRDRALGRNVAIKTLEPSLLGEPELAARFHQEAQITAQLDHPGIVPVYGIEAQSGHPPRYSMKLVRGKDLSKALREARARLDEGQPELPEFDLYARLDIFISIGDAIAYAHDRGVIHRDLKPANIMLGAHHEVLVMDWGIAKLIGSREAILPESAGERSHQTQVGTILGTPYYMSPEQAHGENEDLGPQSDQYALGLILQELVTLRRAVTAKHSMHAILRAQEGSRDPMKHYRGRRIARGLKAIVGKACQADPALRYPHVRDMVDDVRRFLRDEPVTAAPDTVLQSLQRWIARNRSMALGSMVALGALLFAVTATAVFGSFAALQAAELRALEREEVLMELTMRVTEQSGRIDSEMAHYRSLATGLAFTARESLDRPAPSGVRWYSSRTFDPPDLFPSDFYDDNISISWPDIHITEGTPKALGQTQARQLASISSVLQRALFESLNREVERQPAAARRALVGNGQLPAAWAYVATEQGVIAGFPGVQEFDEDYDPRTMPWYRAGRAADKPTWTALELDEGGLGLLLTCLVPFGQDGANDAGVAAIDLRFDHVVNQMLRLPETRVREAYLVSRDGNIVASSSMNATARTMTEYAPALFPVAEVLTHIDKPSGHLLLGDRLYLWRRLQTVDWAYIVETEASVLP